MRYIFLAAVFVLHVSFYTINSRDDREWKLNLGTVPRGYRISDGHVFKVFDKFLFTGCLKECTYRKRCKKFTFHTGSLTCQLGYSTNTELTTDSGYMTSAPEDWLEFQDVAGPCAYHTCAVGSRCIPLKSNETFCMPSECGRPANIFHATEQPTDWSIGSTFQYSCTSGYVMHNPPAQIKCLSSGQWSPTRRFYCLATSCQTSLGYTAGTICYKKYSAYAPPASARRQCEKDGGQLAKLETSTKYNYINARFSSIHIDGTDSGTEGSWYYFDGTPITYNVWTSGYGNRGSTYNCRYLSSNMRDIKCSDWYHYLCEIP